MPHTQTTPITAQSEVGRPICPRCGSEMWIVRIRGEGSDKEQRTFNCPVCEISTCENELSTHGAPMAG